MLKYTVLLCTMIIAGSFPVMASAGQEPPRNSLHIACAEGLNTNPTVVTTLTKIYSRIGIDIEISGLPPKRSIMLVNEGLMDAECSRIYNISRTYPNLFRIPTPIYQVRVGLYSLKTGREFRNWSDLAGYKIGLLGGTFFAEEASKKFDIVFANDPGHLFNLLLAGRIDFALLTDVIGPRLITSDPRYAEIHLTAPRFMEFFVYHYVHKKHRNLVDSIDGSIKALQASGEIKLHEDPSTVPTVTQNSYSFDPQN